MYIFMYLFICLFDCSVSCWRPTLLGSGSPRGRQSATKKPFDCNNIVCYTIACHTML